MMAMAGSSYLAWLLLLIDSLLLPANPTGKAVPAHQLYQYVPNSAQMVFHIDLRSMKTHFEQSLHTLSKKPFVANDPTIKSMFEQLDRMVKRAMFQAEREFKVVKVDQIRFITVALIFEKRFSKPEVLVTVNGQLSLKMLEGFVQARKAQMTKEASKGFTFYYSSRRSRPSFAWTPTGQILIATPQILRQLNKVGPQKATPGSLKANMISRYRPNHAIAVGLQMTPIIQRQFRRTPMMFQTLLMNMDQAYGAVWGGGSLATIDTTDPKTLQRYKLILEGVGQLGVAGDFFRRGMLNIADGLFEPTGKESRNPILASLAKHKAGLFNYVRQLIRPNRLRYKVSTSGKSVRLRFVGTGGAVIPLGGFLAGIALFARSSRPPRAKAYPYRRYPRKTTPMPPATNPNQP